MGAGSREGAGAGGVKMDLSKAAEEIVAVVKTDYKAAKAQRPFAWDMADLKGRIEAVLRRRLEEGEMRSCTR